MLFAFCVGDMCVCSSFLIVFGFFSFFSNKIHVPSYSPCSKMCLRFFYFLLSFDVVVFHVRFLLIGLSVCSFNLFLSSVPWVFVVECSLLDSFDAMRLSFL